MAIIIPIGVDTKGLRRLDTAGAKLRAFGKIAAVAAGAAAFGGLVKTLDVGVKKFIEQDKAIRQTNARLKSTGGIANVTADGMVKLSDAIANKTGIDDDAIHSMGNMLLTFTNIRNEVGKNNNIFDQAVQITTDLSVAFEKDLTTSAIMVGKALNDPVKGVTALGRAGVQFTDQQKEQIKALVESGKTMDAQKLILRELETQVGGSAKAFGETLPGQLSKLRQSFDEVALEVANKFIPKIFDGVEAVKNFLNEFRAQPTLLAKINFTIGTFAGLTWNGIRTIYAWWNRETERVELPARVVFTAPGGRQQVTQLIDDLAPAARAAGNRLGVAAAEGLFSGSSRTLGAKLEGNFIRALQVLTNPIQATGDFLGRNLVGPFIAGFVEDFVPAAASQFAAALRRAFDMAVDIASNGIRGSLGRVTGLIPGRARSVVIQVKKITNEAVKDIVRSARDSLGGLASTVTGFLNQLVGSNSPQAKRLKDIRKQQEDERRVREETELRARLDAAETDEARAQAQRDLDDFLLEEEARRLEREIADEQEANEQKINNLVERFNQGRITAQEFANDLAGILGPERGLEIGEAFAGGFQRAIDELVKSVKSIFALAGTTLPERATGPGLVGQAKDIYEADVADWRDRRAARKKQAEDARKRKESDEGEKITADERAQINNIMKAWDKKNPKPKKAAYGLAMGGILKDTVFAAGEMGPEAVIPLDSQAAWNMLRDAATGTGGGGSTVINLTVNAGLGTNPDELSRVIVDSIKRYERRNGQVFSGPLVTATTTASGVATTASGGTDFNRITARRRG